MLQRNNSLSAPPALAQAVRDFLRYLEDERDASPHTRKSYREDLEQALQFWHNTLGHLPTPSEISTRHVRAFLAWLHQQNYSRSTIARRLAALRAFFRFLCRQQILDENPAESIRSPRRELKLPHFLTESDTEKLLEVAHRGRNSRQRKSGSAARLAVRDRALLEVLYSAGLRVSEVVGVNLEDLDLDGGTLLVRGKGKKERLAYSANRPGAHFWNGCNNARSCCAISDAIRLLCSSTKTAPGSARVPSATCTQIHFAGRTEWSSNSAYLTAYLCYAPAGSRR
jgi:site-specific recombinase XerD